MLALRRLMNIPPPPESNYANKIIKIKKGSYRAHGCVLTHTHTHSKGREQTIPFPPPSNGRRRGALLARGRREKGEERKLV